MPLNTASYWKYSIIPEQTEFGTLRLLYPLLASNTCKNMHFQVPVPQTGLYLTTGLKI